MKCSWKAIQNCWNIFHSLIKQKEHFMKQKALISEECWFVRSFLDPRRKFERYYVSANLFFRVTKSEMVDDLIPKDTSDRPKLLKYQKNFLLYCISLIFFHSPIKMISKMCANFLSKINDECCLKYKYIGTEYFCNLHSM